ncbi:hypothetical protein B4U80_13687 [Leptotrombidium deliense]|uniref:Thioredoxin domain-containing protein n=1 Tax=Leptotrombidium deliense TaxID=299467 RepID=A0A443SKW6_9ACAR|nr:hypothetical protein B4U80_13687 [Leptotrombidium deliense]
MKCVTTIVTLMTLLCFTAAKKGSDSEVIRFLNAASRKTAVLKFDHETLEQIIGRETIPRNYSLALMMTVNSHQCKPCQKAYEQYEIIASSWRHSKSFSSKLFFGCIYADESRTLFDKYKLEHVPALFLFSEYDNIDTPRRAHRFDYSAENIRRWIASETGIRITIVKPIDFSTLWSYRSYFSRKSSSVTEQQIILGNVIVIVCVHNDFWTNVESN